VLGVDEEAGTVTVGLAVCSSRGNKPSVRSRSKKESEVTMAKRYDVIVVGAGPAGFVAAKAAGENGLEVALLERKSDLTQLTRACGESMVSMNEYFWGDLAGYNDRDKRICFPGYGFSVKYDGGYKNLYSAVDYAPNGCKIELGDLEKQRKKGDHGRVGLVFDKQILFRCLLEEVKACSVDIFPGINVEKVTSTAEGVKVEGSGQSFGGTYLIAADGANSRIADMMGFNKDRAFYCHLRAISYYVSGTEPPESDVVTYAFGFLKEGAAFLYLLPRPTEGEYNLVVSSIDPRVNLKVAGDYFMKEAFCAPWFKNAKQLRALSAAINCRSAIVEPYRDHVLVTGDAAATQELENTGAMISGWKAGQAISTTVQEGNLGLEVKGISHYVNWWKEAYVNRHSPDAMMKNFALPYILTTEEEMNYLFGLLQEPMRACFNPYTSPIGKAMRKVMPIIQQEKPELLQKLGKLHLPYTEIIAQVTKISKQVS